MSSSYIGDDDYDYDRRRHHQRRPSAHRALRSQQFLNPLNDSGGLYRTRSQGHAPVPVVNIYNEQIQDGDFRNQSHSRSPSSPRSPMYRGRGNRLGEDLAEGMAGLALENQRLRSRSRGRSDASERDRRADYYEWELRQKDRELREIERQRERDRDEERIVDKYELKREKDEAAAKEERKRVIAEYEQAQREDEEDRKEEERRLRDKMEREEREAKEKAKREEEAVLARIEKRKEKEKADKKEAEEKFEEEMRKRLTRFGAFTPSQIEAMVGEEKEKAGFSKTTTTTTRTSNAMDVFRPTARPPVYAKIHSKYLSTDTLKYYDIQWEYDRSDSNYLIVMREMDEYELEVLFNHTRQLRAGKLPNAGLLEGPKDEREFMWYRKRDRSHGRVKKLGILEFKR